MQKWNQTYACGVIKYTINLPKDLHARALAKQKRLHLSHLSEYIRIVIERDIALDKPQTLMAQIQQNQHFEYANPEGNTEPLTAAELVEEKITARLAHLDPPKKYQGFANGLRRGSYVLQWFRKLREKKLAKINSDQYTLFK